MTQVAAPDLAAIIQRGFPFSEDVVETVRSYCAPLKRARVDTVILGCTHYPLVRPMLQRFLGREVRLVTAGHALAATAQRILESRRLEAVDDTEGTYRFICTGDPAAFRELGTRFLQLPLGEVERRLSVRRRPAGRYCLARIGSGPLGERSPVPRGVRFVLAVVVLLLLAPVGALATGNGHSGGGDDVARYILPPGNYGGLPTTATRSTSSRSTTGSLRCATTSPTPTSRRSSCPRTSSRSSRRTRRRPAGPACA